MSEQPPDDFGWLDSVGSSSGRGQPAQETPRDGASSPRRRRRRKKTGKRSSADYAQVSAWVHKDVKAAFEVARAQEGQERGRPLEFSEVMEMLMDFYSREGNPWRVLEDER